MARWVMQYRTRLNETAEWQEWKNLSEQLTFSSYYQPLYFEFRAITESDSKAFIFHGELDITERR